MNSAEYRTYVGILLNTSVLKASAPFKVTFFLHSLGVLSGD
jgi:hypothetical protein